MLLEIRDLSMGFIEIFFQALFQCGFPLNLSISRQRLSFVPM